MRKNVILANLHLSNFEFSGPWKDAISAFIRYTIYLILECLVHVQYLSPNFWKMRWNKSKHLSRYLHCPQLEIHLLKLIWMAHIAHNYNYQISIRSITIQEGTWYVQLYGFFAFASSIIALSKWKYVLLQGLLNIDISETVIGIGIDNTNRTKTIFYLFWFITHWKYYF